MLLHLGSFITFRPSVFSSKATQLTLSIRKDAEYEQKITQVSQGGAEIWFDILTC